MVPPQSLQSRWPVDVARECSPPGPSSSRRSTAAETAETADITDNSVTTCPQLSHLKSGDREKVGASTFPPPHTCRPWDDNSE